MDHRRLPYLSGNRDGDLVLVRSLVRTIHIFAPDRIVPRTIILRYLNTISRCYHHSCCSPAVKPSDGHKLLMKVNYSVVSICLTAMYMFTVILKTGSVQPKSQQLMRVFVIMFLSR